MSETRGKLLAAAAEIVREQSLSNASARVIAARAEVNQALVFYHFGTVSDLIEAACRDAVEDAVARYREQLAGVNSLAELLQVGRQLHEREQKTGNVAMMAQLMTGARTDPVLARAARYAMDLWSAAIETVLDRLLRDSPLSQVTEPAALARAVSASFIGLELYDGVDTDGATSALDALERLGLLAEVVEDLGPIARRALRSRLKASDGARSSGASSS